MAGRNTKSGSGGFDSHDKVNSSTLKRHPKMDLSRNDLLQLLSYLEGELQARDITIATLKAEKAKQLLYQAKYGRFGLGDPFSAMQRDSENLKDNTFDESAIKSMYDNQLAQLENLIATQRKAQMKMREQMIAGEKKYQKVCTELDDEKRKHAQDTAQGDDVTYMLEKERERLKQEVDFEKGNTKKMEKDLKKTLASLEEERAGSAKHKQVALMLIKERKKIVEKFMIEKQKADLLEKALGEERTKSMNMAEGLVQESKKSLKMEATMERQLSEFDLEREQMRNKLQREENRTKDLQTQVDSLRSHLESLQKQGILPKEAIHSVEIKSTVGVPQGRSSMERAQVWSSSGSSISNVTSNTLTGKSGQVRSYGGDSGGIEHEAGLSPRNSPSDLSVRKRDNLRYASPQPVDRGLVQYSDSNLEQRVAPVGAVSDKTLNDPHGAHKLSVSPGGPTVVSGGGRITVQTGSPAPVSGPVSPRRGGAALGRGVPPPIPPNKPVLPVATISKPAATQKMGSVVTKDGRLSQPGTKPVHIPVSVVHTSSVTTAAGSRTPKRDGSPTTIRKPAQFSDSPASLTSPDPLTTTQSPSPNPDSFDFLGPEMADLQQLLVSMVTGPSDSSSVENPLESVSSPVLSTSVVESSTSSSVSSSSSSPQLLPPPPQFTSKIAVVSSSPKSTPPSTPVPSRFPVASAASPSVASPAASTTAFAALSVSTSASNSYEGSVYSTISSPIPTISSTVSAVSNTSLSLSTSSGWPSPRGGIVELPVNKSAPVFSTHARTSSPATNASLQSSSYLPYSIRKLSPKTSPTKDLPSSPIHRFAASGNEESLRKLIIDLEADVNLPMKDGTTPTHCAAENGQTECLRMLINKGCNVNCLRDDQMSPVHCAAAEGHTNCLLLLLSHGGKVELSDNSGWTPLHWAAAHGHLECCRLLLNHGALTTAPSSTNSTPCHLAVYTGDANCLTLLLTHNSSQSESPSGVRLGDLQDKDGWTIAHLAACREDTECLSVILRHCDIDLTCREKLGRTVLEVSTPKCHQLLVPYVTRERLKHVMIEICCTGMAFAQQQPYIVGKIKILPSMDWQAVDLAIVSLLDEYFYHVNTGLRTKKTSRLDPDIGSPETAPFSLGLNRDCVQSYMIGSYRWIRTKKFPDVSPQDIMCNNNAPAITVFLKGATNDHDSLAYDLLLPVTSINNYVRLLDQYKTVVFYGPEGTRKKQLVKKLANHIMEKENAVQDAHLVQVYLHRDFTHKDFLHLLKSEGCLLSPGTNSKISCILLLFHLEKVHLTGMLGSLLAHIEYRGEHHTFTIQGTDGVPEICYFPDNFYLIATMDKPRSTGLDLSVQQRFRWVNFRINEEPIKNLLARHFYRRLVHTYEGQNPTGDDPVFKALEWLICVWQRLNDGVSKLGLQDVVFGPDMFMPCPIESRDAQTIYEWSKRLWNETISPVIKQAVMRGTGKEGSSVDGQHKVVNTALYVLMQRAIVPGLPISGEDKDRYLADFSGSNELDVSMRIDKQSPSTVVNVTRRSLHRDSGSSNIVNPRAFTKHRSSLGAEGTASASILVNGSANTSVKRRSLSETSLARTEQQIEIPVVLEQTERSSPYIQAKVPKLEIRSPVLGLSLPIQTNFTPVKPASLDSTHISTPHRRSTFSSHSRIPQATNSKRSRSSENLSVSQGRSSGNNGQFRPTSPFSFSLTTPTSSLFSFKFMDDKAGKSTEVNSYHVRSFSGNR